mmetsp:Transcript_112907/g.324515  ORF Transcript_112907/g.324515 Transcript_112907/m.324515 type:complete len:150 (-) Transcript_112907:175-624(-)
MGNSPTPCCRSSTEADTSDAPEAQPVVHSDTSLKQHGWTSTSAAPAPSLSRGQSFKKADKTEREKEFDVCIVKTAGTRLGLDVDLSDGVQLIVDKIAPGLAEEWNAANPDKKFGRGDRIVSVNGVQGNAQKMAEACRKGTTLNLHVLVG